MTLKKLLFFCFLFLCQFISAQNDSITNLKEVVVSDYYLRTNNKSQSIQILNDSVINKNQSSLSGLLNYNSVIYFKEYGRGMLSTVSFRGTTASQTAVVWNGININSQLNGSTDFNTITANDFNSISVKAGGGSVIYGSGAIGGTVHLNNDLVFKKQFSNDFRATYGSFNTIGSNYKMTLSNKKWSSQIGFSHNGSDNDYKYLNTNKRNENGSFYNTSFNVTLGYRVNNANVIKLYNQVFEGKRHLSGTLVAPSKSKYENIDTRNMLEWIGFYKPFTSNLKLALLSEKYKYFEDKDANFYSNGKAESVIAKYNLSFKLNPKLNFNLLTDFTQTKGSGPDIGNNTRQIGSGGFMFSHQIFNYLQYEISVRQEITNDYKSPLLYSFGTKWDVSKNYVLKFNASKNFRIPTFNDLYWLGSGNPNLKPESSYQGELGQELKYKNISFSVTGYYIKIQDMLKWTPGAGGVWSPMNINKVTTYGGEALLNWNKKRGSHFFNLNGTYAYTVSNDEQKNKQLIYVPYHKLTASASYSFKKITPYYQFLYNGQVFTSSDNFYFLDSYMVSNFGIDYDFGKKYTYKIGVQGLNILNENYQSMAVRPMSGRSFNINLTLKF